MDSVHPIASPSRASHIDFTKRSAPPSRPTTQLTSAPDRVELSGSDRLGSPVAHGAKAVYDFMLGDDLDNALGKDKSFGQRAPGTASLASNFFPLGKVAAVGIKALAHIGVAFGTDAVAHAGVSAGAHVAERAVGAAAPEGVAVATSVVRDVGGANPCFDLKAIERGIAGEPHTLAQHVAKDEPFLEKRIVEDGKNEASTFNDLAAAQRSADSIVGNPDNQAKIQKWIDSGMLGNLRLNGLVPGDSIGRVLSRVDVAARNPSRVTSHATVILKSDANSPAKYTILTSYPIFQAR